MKNIIFATVLNDAYVPGMVALIKSIKYYNPNFNYRFVVFYSTFLPFWGSLSSESVELLDSLYDFEFVEPDFRNYLNNGSTVHIEDSIKKITPGRMDIKYLSIESFNLSADKVIFFDVDMICLGDLSKLVEFEVEDIAMVHCKCSREYYVGVMVVGKKNLNNHTYLDILKYDDSKSKKFGVDMKLLNEYFKNRIEPLPDEYDAVVTEVQEIDKVWKIASYRPLFEKMLRERNTSLDKIDDRKKFNDDVYVEWKNKYSPKWVSYRKSNHFLKDVKILHYIYSPWIDKGRDDLLKLDEGRKMLELWEKWYRS